MWAVASTERPPAERPASLWHFSANCEFFVWSVKNSVFLLANHDSANCASSNCFSPFKIYIIINFLFLQITLAKKEILYDIHHNPLLFWKQTNHYLFSFLFIKHFNHMLTHIIKVSQYAIHIFKWSKSIKVFRVLLFTVKNFTKSANLVPVSSNKCRVKFHPTIYPIKILVKFH